MEALFTRAEYDLLPEGFPAQLIEGQLVKEPSATYGHQRLASRLFAALLPLVPSDHLVFAPADVGIDEHNVFQPDLLVLSRIPPLDRSDVGIPLLAIEILSPSTAKCDRRIKTPRLLAAGTREVWLVDPANETIDVCTGSGRDVARGSSRAKSAAIPRFEIVPADLFA